MTDSFHTQLHDAVKRFRKVLRWTITAGLVGIGLQLIADGSDGARLAQGVCALAIFAIGLVLPSGVVGSEPRADFARAAAPSGSFIGFHAKRIAVVQLVNLCILLSIVPVLLAAALVDGVPLWTAVRTAAGAPILGLLAGAATIAFSCWAVTKDAVVALLYIFLTAGAGAPVVYERMQVGEDTIVRHLVFPGDAFQAFGLGVDVYQNLGIILAHFAFWAAVSGLGLVWLQRKSRRPDPAPTGSS